MFDWWKKWFEPKPFYQGYLPEREGHQVFFMEFGNPQGKPVLMFHGGPGGCCKAKYTTAFDLKKYRVIVFDQRGCGKSLPMGSLKNNDTQSLLKDVENLIKFLKIKEKIILRGASWGSTLALLFAEKHPQMVEKLLLSQIFLADKDARFWEFEGNSYFYPDFVETLKNKAGKTDIPTYFDTEINSKSKKKQLDAINYYGWYERVCGSLSPKWNNQIVVEDKELAANRVYMHYAAQNFMLKDDEIIKNVGKIKNIPTIIVHNRLDFVCPLKGAYRLHKGLPKSKLIIIPERGHVGKMLYKIAKIEFRKFLER